MNPRYLAGKPKYSVDHILVAVRQVAEAAKPDQPGQATQREFDAARATAGIECPRASDIARRLKTPWADLLHMVFDEESNEFHQVAIRIRGRGNKYPVDHATCVAAVRLAAAKLGRTTVLPHEYMEVRGRVIGSSRGSNRTALRLRWPPDSQIEKIGWNRVLSEAGLEVPSRAARPRRGISNAVAMDLFLKCRGYLPQGQILVEFASAHHISLSRKHEKFEDSFEALKKLRQASGAWIPPRRLNLREAPPMSREAEDEEARLASFFTADHRRNTRSHWTDQKIIDGIDFAVRELPPGKSLTQKELRKLARKYPDQIPSATTVTRYTNRNGVRLKDLRQQALERHSTA